MSASAIHFIHDRAVTTESHVLLLQVTMGWYWRDVEMTRELYPHENPLIPLDQCLRWALEQPIEEGALVIGHGYGGLIAAAMQENGRPDLSVMCIGSETAHYGIELSAPHPNRWAFYLDEGSGHADTLRRWPSLAKAYNLPFLSWKTNNHVRVLAAAALAIANDKPVEPMVAEAMEAWRSGTYEEWRLN